MSVNTPTNTKEVSYCPRPTLIRKPSPRLAPTSSPTTAPITERVAPMRSPPSKTGSAAGNSSSRNVCQRLARRERIKSRKFSGTLRSPTTVLTSTGKKTIREQMSTLEKTPGPNQMTSKGAIATVGTAWLATRKGCNTFSINVDLERKYPRRVAKTTPLINPHRISKSVAVVWRSKEPSEIARTNRALTCNGEGRIKAGRCRSHTSACQVAKKIASVARMLTTFTLLFRLISINKKTAPFYFGAGNLIE